MPAPETEHDPLIGSTVGGKYRVDRLLGRGGMGAVYQATNVIIGKRVALKFLDREAARDLDAVARFQREAEAASAVESEHIVHIFDSGITDDKLPFLVLELLNGEDLRERLKREGRLEPAETVQIAAQVLRGLARAHAAGIVHRDLKPDNIFLCARDDGELFVKIVDFGISKVARGTPSEGTLTRRGTVLGTAYYMSPEQAQAFTDIDGRTDLYSLGSILYECLAGRPPHGGAAYEAILINICTKDADDIRLHAPQVPAELAALIQKALQREREFRFQSAAEFLEALLGSSALRARPLRPSPAPAVSVASDFVPGAPSETASGTSVQTSSELTARRRVTRTIVVALLAALAAFTVTLLLTGGRGAKQAAAPEGGAAAQAPSATLEPPATAATTATPAKPPEVAAGAADASIEAPKTAAKPRVTRKPKTTSSPPPSTATAERKSGVASGLQLKTTDP